MVARFQFFTPHVLKRPSVVLFSKEPSVPVLTLGNFLFNPSGPGLSLVLQISKPMVPVLVVFFNFKNLWVYSKTRFDFMYTLHIIEGYKMYRN
jgi:hypothetical protein